MEVELVEDAENANAGRREFEDHESAAWSENPESFTQCLVETGHVPDTECDDGTSQLSGCNWKLDGVSGHRSDSGALDLRGSRAEHRFGEVGADHQSSKPGQPRDLGGNVHRARAQIEIPSGLIAIHSQLGDRLFTPAPVDVEAEDVIQEVVTGSDLREDPLYVRALLGATGSGGTGGRAVYVGGQHLRKLPGNGARGKLSYPRLPLMTPQSYTDVSDQQVVVFAQEGREDAYRELIKRYERPVFSLIFRMVRDKETAEDLSQETFIKVLNNIDRYRPEFKFSSWLFKIANNITIDHLRRRQIDTISIEGAPDAITAERARATAVTVTSGGESALEELESRELGEAIEKAIARLRPEYRACIILRHVEDYSYDEIAEIVKLPLGTVKTYIHRARQELREYLGDLK